MYDDILGKPESEDKPKKKLFRNSKVKGAKDGGPISWDFSKYLKKPYCYGCNSTNIKIVSDVLKKNGLKKRIRCNDCNNEWFEIWDKNIDLNLELTELRF